MHQPRRIDDSSRPELVNASFWGGTDRVADYATRVLNPAETTLLLRHHEALSHRVLEIGCGGGRVLGYLVALGGEVHGIDVSESMVRYCGERYPEALVQVGDLRGLTAATSGRFDAVLAPDNVIDVLDHDGRQRVLGDLREILAERGLLIFSSHNLGFVASSGSPRSGGVLPLDRLLDRNLRSFVSAGPRILRRARNRRRLAPLQYRAGDHAVLNDSAHDYSLLHYYIGRDDQVRQLEAAGFELLECLDLEGSPVAPGEIGDTPSLYYAARAGR
jgi:SAM-dependent methyltransferase